MQNRAKLFVDAESNDTHFISCFPFPTLGPICSSSAPIGLHKEPALKHAKISRDPLMCFLKTVPLSTPFNPLLSKCSIKHIYIYTRIYIYIHEKSRVNGVRSGLAHGPALSAALDHEIGHEALMGEPCVITRRVSSNAMYIPQMPCIYPTYIPLEGLSLEGIHIPPPNPKAS